MIIVLKRDCSDDQLAHVLKKIEEFGLKHEVSRGIRRTLIGVIGDEERVRNAPLKAIPGVEEVVPVLKPYKLASREFHEEDSVFDVSCGVRIGGGALGMIAGLGSHGYLLALQALARLLQK